MSNFAWIILLVLILTIIGTLTLVFVTVRYYWADRGVPPLKGEEKRQARENELRLRSRQIENSEKHPIVTRKSSFWDNGKVSDKNL